MLRADGTTGSNSTGNSYSCRFKKTRQQPPNEWDDVADDWDDIALQYNQSLYQHFVTHQLFPSIAATTTTSTTATTTNNDQELVREIRIIDFGCGTGLFIRRMVQYYQKQFDLLQQREQAVADAVETEASATANSDVVVQQQPVRPATTTITKTKIHIIGIDSSRAMIRLLKETIRNYGWNSFDRDDNDANGSMENSDLKITVTAIEANIHEHHCWWQNHCSGETTTTTTTTKATVDDAECHGDRQQLRTILHDWTNTVNLVICSSVLSYLKPSSVLPVTIQLLAQLVQPNQCGRFVHADWTTTIDTSSSSSWYLTLSDVQADIERTTAVTTTTTTGTTTADQRHRSNNDINGTDNDDTNQQFNNNNNGIMTHLIALRMYSVMYHHHGLALESIDTVQFRNVYHNTNFTTATTTTEMFELNQNHHGASSGCNNKSSDTDIDSGSDRNSIIGSNVLIGVAQRRKTDR